MSNESMKFITDLIADLIKDIVGGLKSRESLKAFIVISALYIWRDMLVQTPIAQIPFNTLILSSGVILIITLGGLAFICIQYLYKKKKS